MPRLLGCCGKPGRDAPMARRKPSGLHSGQRPHFTYVGYEAAQTGVMSGSSSPVFDKATAAAFAFRGMDAEGVTRNNPLFAPSPLPPRQTTGSGSGNTTGTVVNSAFDPDPSPPETVEKPPQRKASEVFAGFDAASDASDDVADDSTVSPDASTQRSNSDGDEVFGGFADVELNSGVGHVAVAARPVWDSTPIDGSEGDDRWAPRSRLGSRSSIGSIDSAFFAGLPVASVEALTSSSVGNPRDSGQGCDLPSSGTATPAPSTVEHLLLGSGRIAGDGLESVVCAPTLPRVRIQSSRRRPRRSRSTSFAVVAFSVAYINRKLLEAYMLLFDGFNEDDTRRVKAQLDDATALFDKLDPTGSGEVDWKAVMASTMGPDPTDPSETDEVRIAFVKADEDKSGTLRYREFANFMLIRAAEIVHPLVDTMEPTLMANGALRIPEGTHYGTDQGLKDLAASHPGLFRKQARGEVRLAAQAEPTPAGYHLQLTIEEAVHLIAPCASVRVALVLASGKRLHRHTSAVPGRESQHPRVAVSVAWQVPRSASTGAMLVIRFLRRGGGSSSLGAVAFHLRDVISSDVVTAGWFHLLSDATALQGTFFPSLSDPGPSKCAVELPVDVAEALQRRDGGHTQMPPRSLHDIRVSRILGTGSFGKVALATDSAESEFAVKGINKAAALAGDDVDQVLVERYVLTEVRHPFVVRLFSTFETETNLYFCLEPLLGGTLAEVAKQERPLPPSSVAFYGAEILLGLWHLHDCGVLYRDLKLENVLLDAGGHIRLADFGLAKVLPPGTARTHTMCGTPEYVAPELLSGVPYGRSVDFWSFGVLLYRLRLGVFPFARGDGQPAEAVYRALRAASSVKLPDSTDRQSAETIEGLLAIDMRFRLGCDLQRGAEDLRGSPLFAKTNWQQMARRGKKPPVRPKAARRRNRMSLGGVYIGEDAFALDDKKAAPLDWEDQEKFAGFAWSQDYVRDEMLGLRPSRRR